MKYLVKTVVILVIISYMLFFLWNLSGAQFEATGSFIGNPSFENKPLQVPSWQDQTKGEGDLLIDNFEYWDSPYNHGWKQLMPSYPEFGFGSGYTSVMNTVLDLQEGSRVLEVFRPSYIYLLGTTYGKHSICYELYSPPSAGDSSLIHFINLAETPVLSLKFKTPFNLEPWEMFEFDICCSNALEYEVVVKIKPLQPAPSHESTDCDYNPRFEGILRTVTICTDAYGASDVGRRNIHCVNPGTWFNHPPVVTSLPNPRVIRAGEEVVLNARAEDPDGDEVYASCNFGSIGQVANGDTIWTFQTNFPGIYNLEIIFFDIRGGYALANTSIEVVPWWSY